MNTTKHVQSNETLHKSAADLLAYDDGLLSGSEKKAVEALLEVDCTAREFLAKMNQSRLPIRAAFEPLLTSLDADEVNVPIQKAVKQLQTHKLSRFLLPLGLAASLLLGITLTMVYQQYTKVDRSNWMVQVAEYQQLYVRDTVQTSVLLNPGQIEQLQARLSQALGNAIQIPDLSSQQLTFMRGQVLSVNDAPLIQLVYLPAQGKPIALCITPKKNSSSVELKTNKLTKGSARGLALVHWQDSLNQYVLMGDHPIDTLLQHAKAI